MVIRSPKQRKAYFARKTRDSPSIRSTPFKSIRNPEFNTIRPIRRLGNDVIPTKIIPKKMVARKEKDFWEKLFS